MAKRIKIRENFYLDEFVHPEILKRFKKNSIRFLNENLIDMVQYIRTETGVPIFINGWFNGKLFTDSGLRDYLNPLNGVLNKSCHYYGLVLDIKTFDIEALQIWIYDNRALLKEKFGLSVIEHYKYTPNWCHISVEWNNSPVVKIMIP